MCPGSQADHQPELLMINHVTKTMVNGNLLKTISPMVFAMDFGPPGYTQVKLEHFTQVSGKRISQHISKDET